jgi:hypothetical protein
MRALRCAALAVFGLFAATVSPSLAAEPVEAQSGGEWRDLFNGTDLSGWQDARGNKPGEGWVIEDGALVRKSRAGDIWTKDRFGDFVLDLEFKTTGNSGVFIRTDKPTDNVQTGLEVQVIEPSDRITKNSVGSIYDALAPTKNAAKKDDWNRLVITARDNKVLVQLNGEQIIDMDLNQWTEAGKNPDGSKNKYRTALKDFKREGHIGFQDHGAAVAFRNVKIKPLGSEAAP